MTNIFNQFYEIEFKNEIKLSKSEIRKLLRKNENLHTSFISICRNANNSKNILIISFGEKCKNKLFNKFNSKKKYQILTFSEEIDNVEYIIKKYIDDDIVDYKSHNMIKGLVPIPKIGIIKYNLNILFNICNKADYVNPNLKTKDIKSILSFITKYYINCKNANSENEWKNCLGILQENEKILNAVNIDIYQLHDVVKSTELVERSFRRLK